MRLVLDYFKDVFKFTLSLMKCPICGTNMIFLELYFKHKPVSLQELYEKAMRKHRCRSPALHSALPQLRYS